MQSTHSEATTLHAALGSVLPANDLRLGALSAALATGDSAMIDAAVSYVQNATTPELSATVEIKRRLMSEVADTKPIFACVVDVGAVGNASGRPDPEYQMSVRSALTAEHRFTLCPEHTANGKPLAVRIVMPNGIDPQLLHVVADYLRTLSAGLMATREPQRVAQLAAVPVVPIVPGVSPIIVRK